MISLGLALIVRAEAADAKPVIHDVKFGNYRLRVTLAANWRKDSVKDATCAVFQYTNTLDGKWASEAATIGIFQFEVPAAARTADKAVLGAAYAREDISGARKTLLGVTTPLAPVSPKPENVSGGLLLSYGEPDDVSYRRVSSTQFTRALVFFPASFAQDGVLFLILGRQKSETQQSRAEELEPMAMMVSGLSHR